MADRYYTEPKTLGTHRGGPMHLVIDRKGINDCPCTIIAETYTKAEAMLVADALNACHNLAQAVWGPEGCPAWLEGGAK